MTPLEQVAAGMRLSGAAESDIQLVMDLARNASDKAAASIDMVVSTAPLRVRAFVLLGAMAEMTGAAHSVAKRVSELAKAVEGELTKGNTK